MIKVYLISIYIIAAITTIILTIMVMHLEKRYGILCIDVHKVKKHSIPCIGGFSIAIGFVAGVILLYISGLLSFNETIAIATSIVLSTFIGVIDDFNDLKSRWKILLGLLPGLPIIISNIYMPRPWIPFLGHARLTIVYPLLILIAFTVYQNGANMIDTHNGTLPMFAFSIHLFALLLKLFTYSLDRVHLVLIFIVVLASYLPFNIYPAKIFNGNTGSFVIGSSLAISAIMLRAEIYYILASIPMFINSFYYISSVKGFLQKENVKRPTYIDSKGCIHPSEDSSAPVTLIRIVTTFSRLPLSEKELVIILYTLFILTSFTSFITMVMLGYR
jgi:UDP-N-acetylglucosamine--dolichyl-phosphate N-acetylglucosaminephosphotransferase